MSDWVLVEALRTTAAFKAMDPSSAHLVELLKTAAARIAYLTGELH